MEKRMMIINGSPRAPKSNSKRYAEILMRKCRMPVSYFSITRKNHDELCQKMGEVSDVVLVFPLYADAIPVTLLDFLKELEKNLPQKRPVISVIINCGFFEYRQNDMAIEMVKLFAERHGFPFGSVLEIGSGEAILDSPFKFMVKRRIGRFSKSLHHDRYRNFRLTMPITKKIFLRASTQYWLSYGRKFNTTEDLMRTMEIEGNR